uniref:wee1-like protein kinase isoform X2 n=1 Tax=Erigeron canadensis TaxID=72917 RepID=UPI001CB985D4|nr:wee1-like protein kinase isoform X2 [Erigeron canadensis]
MRGSFKRSRTTSNSSRRDTNNKKMKGSLTTHLSVQLGQITFKPPIHRNNNSLRFQNLLDEVVISGQDASESVQPANTTSFPSAKVLDFDTDVNLDDKDFILSQDFFCTPDYITPEAPPLPVNVGCNKLEEMPCPKSPEKLKSIRSNRQRAAFLKLEDDPAVETETDDKVATEHQINKQGYVSQSAVALRCRVMPPPCMKNPYIKDTPENGVDPFGDRRSKCAVFLPAAIGGDGLSRYQTDFHEIEQIGTGNFSHVFKVLKRIDGCMYAVKRSSRKLYQDTDRQKALMEVQALAAIGYHDNVVGYNTSWFENEQLYIQMELCDHSLSINHSRRLSLENEVLEAMHQIAKALQFIHEKGIVHLDVKPENIYVKNGIYKLGDFGCASLLDGSLPIEEGDARYMPQEILNDNYDHLDKVDIFSLGATIYELARGSMLPESGPYFQNLREGKLPLLPGHSVHFQNILKVMLDPDPIRRPSAKELIFEVTGMLQCSAI